MIKAEFDQSSLDATIKKLKGIPQEAMRLVVNVVKDTVLEMQTTAKQPGYAPYKSGNLRRSITHKVESQMFKNVVGTIGSNLEYARIQEFGGEIRASGSGFLKFKGRNGWAAVKKVIIKPKFYLTRAVKDNKQKLISRLNAIKVIRL